jgi:hypothetical protein
MPSSVGSHIVRTVYIDELLFIWLLWAERDWKMISRDLSYQAGFDQGYVAAKRRYKTYTTVSLVVVLLSLLSMLIIAGATFFVLHRQSSPAYCYAVFQTGGEGQTEQASIELNEKGELWSSVQREGAGKTESACPRNRPGRKRTEPPLLAYEPSGGYGEQRSQLAGWNACEGM